MAKEQLSEANWLSMLKMWSLEQRVHNPVVGASVYYDGTDDDHPPPQWRGMIKDYFLINPPPKGYDINDRVYDISLHFELPCSEDESEDEVKTKEELMNELQEYVTLDSVDVAKVLHSNDCLSDFLHHVLPNKDAGIRAKGAEVVTTMVQNNSKSQQFVIKEGGLNLLLHNFTKDPDETSRTKALGAISSLIRNNNSGITEFQRESGDAALMNALISRSVCQRDVLNLIKYLMSVESWDCSKIADELGLPYIMMNLSSIFVGTRDDELKQALQKLIHAMDDADDAVHLAETLKRKRKEEKELIHAMDDAVREPSPTPGGNDVEA